jgi:hypothetical protein
VCFFWEDISVGTNRFDPVTLVTYIFKTLIMPRVSFEWYLLGLWYFTWVGTNWFDLVTLTFLFDLLTETLSLAISLEWYVLEFWYFTRVLWQELSVGTNKFDLLTLTFAFDRLTENFNPGINFEWHILELWYFTWVYLETSEYQQIWPCDLDFGVWSACWKL